MANCSALPFTTTVREMFCSIRAGLSIFSDWEIERPPKRGTNYKEGGELIGSALTQIVSIQSKAQIESERLFTNSHLVLLVGIDCVKIGTLVAGLHRAGSSETVRLVELIEVHKSEIASIVPCVN